VGGVAGVVDLFEKMFPAIPPTSVAAGDSYLRVQVALNDHADENAEGRAPQVNTYDDFYRRIGGNFDSAKIKSGAFTDLTINDKNGFIAFPTEEPAQPTYVQLTADNDAICIASLTHTWPDAQRR